VRLSNRRRTVTADAVGAEASIHDMVNPTRRESLRRKDGDE